LRFIPHIIRREKGDILSSEVHNTTSKDIYADIKDLYNRYIEMMGKVKFLSDSLDAQMNGATFTTENNNELPIVNVNNISQFNVENVSNLSVDKRFREFVIPNISSKNILLDNVGKLKEYLSVRRSSDNFIFSQYPDAVVESPILECVQKSQYPYVIKTSGIDESILFKISLESFNANIGGNILEIINFPTVGGTTIEDIKINTLNNYSRIKDYNGNTLSMFGNDREKSLPNRFVINSQTVNRIEISARGKVPVENGYSNVAGIASLKVHETIYTPTSYIGFSINVTPGYYLSDFEPVPKWNNPYKGIVNTRIYKKIEDAIQYNKSFISEFNQNGFGIPVIANQPVLYVVSKITLENNWPVQFTGYNWKETI